MAGPLEGVRILDFTTLLPGPFSTMMLGDLGADVLKVEAPHRPDLLRLLPPSDGVDSVCYQAVNRNKRSIAIDLKVPEGVALVKRLVGSYDVVVEQFRPGVMGRLRLGYDDLKEANQGLVYCSITGYGQDGPYRDRAGHDNNYLALAGVMSFSGRKQSGPTLMGVQIADVGAGSYNAAVAILAALLHRERTGEGQHVDISMTDGAIGWSTMHAARWLVAGDLPDAEADYLNGGSFYDFYRTKDNRYLSVGSIEPQFFARFCAALGREDLIAKAPFEAGEVWNELKEEIGNIIAARTLDEWVEVFDGVDACVEPVLTIEEMSEHPNTLARGMVVEVPTADGNVQRQIASPFKLSRTGPTYRCAGPGLGEHTEEALRENGIAEEEIEVLRRKGVFG